MTVNLNRQTIKGSPRFESAVELNRKHENDKKP
ncbi:hypothetical protein GALL_409820 [mine drainage metagenome]|uniref:Uncharacterized protein n=1 Tax=mine drainage metagenome TaxID=410659 RepID=A0A1J5Q0T5_9ZZZZ